MQLNVPIRSACCGLLWIAVDCCGLLWTLLHRICPRDSPSVAHSLGECSLWVMCRSTGQLLLCLTEKQGIKVHEGIEVQLHTFIICNAGNRLARFTEAMRTPAVGGMRVSCRSQMSLCSGAATSVPSDRHLHNLTPRSSVETLLSSSAFACPNCAF